MKNKPILIIGFVLLLCGGLIGCKTPSFDSASKDTPAAENTIEQANIVTAEPTSESGAGVTVKPTTTLIASDTPSPKGSPSVEWVTFEDPFGVFTLRYPPHADFSA